MYLCRCSVQQVPRSSCTKKTVTPLESSHGHHLPARAASARAARGRRFDPERTATAPGCRACSASRAHHDGSLHSWTGSNSVRLPATAIRGAARHLLTMAHIHRIVRPRCSNESFWLRAGRVCAYACLLYTSPSPRDRQKSRMPSSA